MVSIICYKHYKHVGQPFKFFPAYLFATLTVETYSSYLNHTDKNNMVIYNYFSTFEFLFYLLFLITIINKRPVKVILTGLTFIYIVACLVNIMVFLRKNEFHTSTYVFGCLLLMLACSYYFFELLRFPKPGRLNQNPAFWICTGLFFFYCCSFPLYGLINFWPTEGLVLANFEHLLTILNVFLYSLFTIGFLCITTRKFTL